LTVAIVWTLARVFRGGGWFKHAGDCRSAIRDRNADLPGASLMYVDVMTALRNTLGMLSCTKNLLAAQRI